MKAQDLEFRFEANIGDEITWHGHAIYKKLPYSALELMGKQMNSQNGGFTTPMKYAKADAEYGTETLFWMNINDAGTMATGEVQMFGMKFPVKGFVNVGNNGRMSTCLKADIEDSIVKKKDQEDKVYKSRYNYVMEKIQNNEKTTQGKDYTPYIIEAAGEIKEEALIKYTESLEGWEDWKARNFKATIKETDVMSPLLALEQSINEVPF